MSAQDWKPEVDEMTGEPIYIAEEGDNNMLTFINQFDISIDKAIKLFSLTNFNTSTGNEIRGASFLRYNLTKTDFGWFANRYKKAFCNGYYYEQSNRYDIYFRGDAYNEVYVLKFKNSTIMYVSISWK